MAPPGQSAAAPATQTATRAPAASAHPEADEPTPLFLVAAYTLLLLLGLALGLLGAFLLSAGPRAGTTLVLPIGLLIALVGHPLAGMLGLLLTGTRAGTLTPLVGWSMVVLPLSSGTPEGDVILPGTALSLVFLLVGVLTFGLVALRTRPTRGRSAPLTR